MSVSCHVMCCIMCYVVIYRTLKPSIGIFTFKSDAKGISEPVMADTLQVSPAGNRATVLVVSLNRRFLYVSRDYGQNWDKYDTPTVDFDPVEELYMSNYNPRHMVIRSDLKEVGRCVHVISKRLCVYIISCCINLVVGV